MLEGYGISAWPMADDEVPSLVEMGLSDVSPETFSVPLGQVGKLPEAVPVWYTLQKLAIQPLPRTELGYRLPTLVCALLTSALIFVIAARWRGLWFGVAIAIVVHMSQAFIYAAQLNRFYAMALLFEIAALAMIWMPSGGAGAIAATAVLTVLAILSHNVTLVVFVLAFMAAAPLFVIGWVPLRVLVRSGVSAAISGAIYLGYLRPLVHGWSNTGNPTQVLVSFAAHAGIPAMALAALGAALAISRSARSDIVVWCGLVFAASLGLLQFSNMNWNPRYFLLFMPAMWVLAADAMDRIASALAFSWRGAAWYGAVAIVLAPALLSHFIDGSRHDYRQAAAVVMANIAPAEPVLSDDAETISYYLPHDVRSRLRVRTKVTVPPPGEYLLVCRMNAWMPLPQVPGRRLDLLAEIYRRRFDQFSHILRIYRVAPETP